MSVLQTLKLAVKPVFQPTAEYTRRQKLIVRLQEQQRLAEATIAGKTYHRMRWVLGPWWSKDAAGTVLMTVRYGRKMVELNKGLNAIHVGDISALPAVINQLIKATEAGELDSQLAIIAVDNPFQKSIKTASKSNLKRN